MRYPQRAHRATSHTERLRHCEDCSALTPRKRCAPCAYAKLRRITRDPAYMHADFIRSILHRISALKAADAKHLVPSVGYRTLESELFLLQMLAGKTLIEYTYALYRPQLRIHERFIETFTPKPIPHNPRPYPKKASA